MATLCNIALAISFSLVFASVLAVLDNLSSKLSGLENAFVILFAAWDIFCLESLLVLCAAESILCVRVCECM